VIPVYADKVFTGLEARYQSGVGTIYGTRVDDFWVMNATLFSATLGKKLELSGSIYNLFDEHYSFPGAPEHSQDQILQPGRTFRVKLAYRF
jgi:outer membrane receptor protein involved in Fe transport